jgi:hypothetical protein
MGHVAGEVLRPGIGLHQQPGLLGDRIVHHEAGPQQLVMFGHFHLQGLRNRLTLR